MASRLLFEGFTGDGQPTGANQAAVSGTAGGTYTATEQTLINDTVTLTNEIRAVLVELGLMKGSA